MLTISYFGTLSNREKTEVILKGTFLADRLTEHHYIKLYNVGNFYVEVVFDDRNHFIVDFKAFEQTMFVLPYLEQLRIAI